MAGRLYSRVIGKDFSFDPPYENFSGITFNPLTDTFFVSDNVLDALFEIRRDGSLLRTIDVTTLKNSFELNSDVEGITWMYGEKYALVMEGGEEMAIVNITPTTTSISRIEAKIHDLFGDPKGVAYKASEDAVYWVSQTLPMRVVKSRIDKTSGELITVSNKIVDNLPDAGLADIAFFPKLSPHMFLVGQSSNTIMEVDLTGNNAVLKSKFSLVGWPIPRPGAMAYDRDGSFVVVSKHLSNAPEDTFNVFFPTAPFANLSPIANAGGDVAAIDFDGKGARPNISGSQSNDPDGAIIEYIWHVNNIEVARGFEPSVGILNYAFPVGLSTVSLIVRDDTNATSETTIQVSVKPWSIEDQIPSPYPQPANFPATSVNFIHPGSAIGNAELFFQLKETGHAEIRIYDQLGQEVKVFQTPVFPPGDYRAPWDLVNGEGVQVNSGVYFVVIKTPGNVLKEKLVVVR